MAAPQSHIGPYRITAKLGEGGMGEVWRATDTRLNREVAVKVLPAAVAGDALRLARFTREAQVLASLNHPNIAAIYGVEDRALVMELVEGQTLAERIGGRAMSLEDALPLARQMAEALGYAHEKGVVHRDLKPANVKITPEGTVKILDFGLAKAMSTETSASRAGEAATISTAATVAGTVLGTAAYMSPEQARGQNVDRRADVWAFGVVLYEMLTGERPFGGPTVSDTLAAVLTATPDLERAPAPARRLLRACLEKDPKQRLDSVRAGMLLLEPGEAASTPTARSRARAILPWALLAAGLIAAALVWRFASPAPQPAMHFSAVTNLAGAQEDPSLSPDGRSVAFVSNQDGHYNIYVTVIGGGSLVQITNDPNLKIRPAWSPDGTTIAYARLNDSGIWDIWEVPALGGTPRRVLLNAADPAWSPDSHSLAYENMATGAVWEAGSTGENPRQMVTAIPERDETQPRYSPDGREVAFALRPVDGAPYGELAVADLASGKIRQLTHDNALALSPAWSPDGRFIYFASSRGGTVNIWKMGANGGDPQQITAGEGDEAQLDVSADGKRIVFSTLRQNIALAQMDLQATPGQAPQPLTTDAVRNEFGSAYSPDGKRLAYFTNLKGAQNESIMVSDANGANAVPLVQDSRANVMPSWSADGNFLFYLSEHLGNWEVRRVPVSGGAVATLLAQEVVSMIDVGEDGRILFLGTGGRAEAFDPRNGQLRILGVLPTPAAYWGLLWSPDERAIAYVVYPDKEDDPNAGIWVDDFQHPPRQIFHGWIGWVAHGSHGALYVLEGEPDLNGVVWKVNWDGHGLVRTPWMLPFLKLNYSNRYITTQFDVSPDGRHLAFQTARVWNGNIGMIENVR